MSSGAVCCVLCIFVLFIVQYVYCIHCCTTVNSRAVCYVKRSDPLPTRHGADTVVTVVYDSLYYIVHTKPTLNCMMNCKPITSFNPLVFSGTRLPCLPACVLWNTSALPPAPHLTR